MLSVFLEHVKVQSQQKGTRLLHHNVKNAMAEASAGIDLYISDHKGENSESLRMLREAGGKLRKALRMTWRANQISSIFEGAYSPSPETVVDLRKWVATFGPRNFRLRGAMGTFVFAEPVVAEMFLTVSFDNVAAHAGSAANTLFCATFENGSLRMDISNGTGAGVRARSRCLARSKSTRRDAADASRKPKSPLKLKPASASFSTGLGLNDFREISRLRGILFESAYSMADGRWHSVVEIPSSRPEEAAREEEEGGSTKSCRQPFRAPPIRRIAIVDDLPLNSTYI